MTVPITLTHIGLCVSDLDRARAFYVGALGFAEEQVVDIGEGYGTLIDVPDADIRVAFVTKDGIRLELLSYRRPEVAPGGEPRPMDRPGLAHLSCVVADLDAVSARVREHGGRVLEQVAMGAMIFCTDPDGTRIELRQQG